MPEIRVGSSAMIPIQFDQLLEAVDGTIGRPFAKSYARRNTQLRRVVTDSRRVQPGDLFVALAGSRHHGEEFLAEMET